MNKVSELFTLKLSVATRTLLLENGITTIKDLQQRNDAQNLYLIRGLGSVRLKEISLVVKGYAKKTKKSH